MSGYSETLDEYLDIGIIRTYSETYGRVFGYRDCMDIQKPWKNIWIQGSYGYIQKPMEEYMDIGIVWIFRNLRRIFGYMDYMGIHKPWKNIWIQGLYMDIFRNLWKSIWIQGLYGYIQKPMEEYMDIGIVWIFRNLGSIFGYMDYMDIHKPWKNILV